MSRLPSIRRGEGRAHTLRRSGLAGLLICSVAALGGCAGERLPDQIHGTMTDPAQRHAIVVTAQRERLDVPIAAVDSGAEAHAWLDTTRFVRAFSRSEGRILLIGVPRNQGRRGALSRRLAAVQRLIAKEGIASQRVRTYRKEAGDGSADAITLAYEHIAAVPPVCGDWSQDVTREADVLPYANYGCATQRNLAVMAANPTDLAFPKREVARGSDKRSAAYGAAIKEAPSGGGAATAASSTGGR